MEFFYTKYGHRVVYDADNKVEAKLTSVLKDKEWRWQPVRSDELVSIQSKLPMAKIGSADQPIWVISEKRNLLYSSETWNAIWTKLQKVN
jgi:hypothetical protein